MRSNFYSKTIWISIEIATTFLHNNHPTVKHQTLSIKHSLSLSFVTNGMNDESWTRAFIIQNEAQINFSFKYSVPRMLIFRSFIVHATKAHQMCICLRFSNWQSSETVEKNGANKAKFFQTLIWFEENGFTQCPNLQSMSLPKKNRLNRSFTLCNR